MARVAGPVDLGGRVVETWSYAGQIPGPEIRVRKGQVTQALLYNQLPAATTVHWHGVTVRNDMDGVPGMTQPPVPSGREFTYRFAAAESGTYWYHPHVGVRALAYYAALRPAPSVRLAARQPDVTYQLRLTGGMARYDWGINGQACDMSRPGALQFLMAEGQRVRVVFANTTTMYHPMHIHGHTFALGPAGPRKDSVIVKPGQQVACDFDAANPGQWMTHCHNLYHAPQGGMMAMLGYQT